MFNPSGLKGKDIYLYIWIFKFQIDGTVKILNRALVSIILPMLQKFLSLVHFQCILCMRERQNDMHILHGKGCFTYSDIKDFL